MFANGAMNSAPASIAYSISKMFHNNNKNNNNVGQKLSVGEMEFNTWAGKGES